MFSTRYVLRSLAAAAVVVALLGVGAEGRAQVGQVQDLGIVLDGIITEDQHRALKAEGKLPAAPKGEGFVYVEATPSTVRIAIGNGKPQAAPFTAEAVPAGYQPVRVEAPGYDILRGYVFVEPLKVVRVRVVLPPKEGDLTILSEPSGARVLIDGQAMGVAPVTIEKLAGGEHEVMLTADGGLVWRGRVSIAGGVEVLRARLEASRDAGVALASVAPTPRPDVPQPTVMAAAPAPRPAPFTPAAPTPSVALMPTPATPVAAPVAPVAPAVPATPVAPASATGAEVDLSGLSPELKAMAWQQLAGRQVQIELATGGRTMVNVVEVRGDAVVLKDQAGKSRMVPLAHIAKVWDGGR
jgi:hypothetical protein